MDKKMFRKLILTIITIALSLYSYNLLTQEPTFSISEVNASNFPRISCTFIALDAAGQSYQNLSPADFDVFERGKNMNPTVSVECIDTLVEPAVNIILIIDQSLSMLNKNEAGEVRWDWVKQGAKAFIKAINLKTGTKIGIISFGRIAYTRCWFTDKDSELIDSLENTNPGGGTLYDPPFLDKDNGAIQMFQRGTDPTRRRIVVFLTDGEPNEPPKTDSIVKELQKTNVQVYAITLATPLHQSLIEISDKTGGKAYRVDTKEELENIYRFIALDIQRKQLCNLSWTADYGCDELDIIRNIKIVFKRQGAVVERLYEAPQSSIAKLPIDQSIYDFLDPAPNQSNSLDITITAPTADYMINEIKIIPATYFTVTSWDVGGSGGPPPFEIKAGESRTIRVQFTQGSVRFYREATLYINSQPCPAQVKLIGGITQVRILIPNGGEIYSVCDTVNIRWGGVESDKPVNLFYSSDGGQTWRTIASNVKGLSYRWIPPFGGDKFRVKATVAPASSYIWAKGIGGPENDFGRSIAVTEDNSYIYITGFYSGTIEFENNKRFTSVRDYDLYVAKYDRDGNFIWAQSAGGFGIDTAVGICVDKIGNAYVVGTVQQTATFGSFSPNMPIGNAPYCFVAKYPAGGSNPIVVLFGPNETYNTFKAWGLKIKYKANQAPNPDEIIVLGEYLNQIQTTTYSLPKVTVPTIFTAVLNTDMTIKVVQKGGADDGTFSKSVAFDGNGDRYEIGTFQGTLTSGSIQTTSKGKNDVYIRRYGGSPGSEDISDTTFSVQSPVWVLLNNDFIFGDCTLGETLDSIVAGFICNRGNVPIVIANVAFIGTNNSEFKLGIGLIGLRLMPGECSPIEIVFKPTDIGLRTAQLVITPDCGTDLVLNLQGTGVCSGESIPIVVFKPTNLNVPVDSNVVCIFKNTNSSAVQVKFVLYGPHTSDFSIPVGSAFVGPDSCLNLSIRFTPSGAGTRQAFLRFELPPGCESPITQLIGEGVDADILVRSIDWDGRRILTQNDSDLVILNRSSIDQKLISIDFETPDPHFLFVDTPPVNLPATIRSGDSLVVKLRFIPNEETSYSNTIRLKFEGLLSDLVANVRGDGILPKIELKWTCLDAVKPGDEGRAELEVYNPSTTANLYLYKMDFRYKTGDFNWVSGMPQDVVVPKSSRQVFEVIFTPQTPGTRGDLIQITHDAAPGPEKSPRVDTLFEAQCDGLGLTTKSTVDFGNSLLCVENSYNLVINNDSWMTPITITGYSFDNSDSIAFHIVDQMPIVVPPSNFYTLNIKFTPSESRVYNTTLNLYTSINTVVTVNLTGNGILADFYSDNSELKLQPFFSRKAAVKVKIPQLYSDRVETMLLNLHFNEKMIRIDKILPSETLTNWVWEEPKTISPGVVQLLGQGTIVPPIDAELFTIEFTVFLGDVKESDIGIEMISNSCPTPIDNVTKVILSGVCFVDGRLVVVGEQPYALYAPGRNPIDDETDIKYSVAFEGVVRLELYNVFGQKVRTILQENLKAGEYTIRFPTSDFANGIYYLKMAAGSFIEIIPIVIAK